MKNQISKRNVFHDFFRKDHLLRLLILSISLPLALSCDSDDGNNLPKVITKEVSTIEDITSDCGGTIIDNGNSKIVAMGLCWTKEDNDPSVDNQYVAAGTYTINGIEETEWDFTATMIKLTPKTTYKVRAYAANENGVAYGETQTFTTKAGKTFHKLTADMIETFTQEVEEGPKEGLVDDNYSTYWHSAWSDNVAPLPHYIQINFDAPTAIGGFQYWHRSPSGKGGRPNSFDVQTSDDGTTWATVWESEKNLPTDIMPPKENNLSLLKNYTAKHFRIRILSTPNNTTFTYLSEIKVYHDGLLD